MLFHGVKMKMKKLVILPISNIYIYIYISMKAQPIKRLTMLKKVSKKSTVFDNFTKTTNGQYFVCRYIVEDDDNENTFGAKISKFCGAEKMHLQKSSKFQVALAVLAVIKSLCCMLSAFNQYSKEIIYLLFSLMIYI